MRILYFCEEYFWNHGGRTHAREFFSALKQSPEVTYASVLSRFRNDNAQTNESTFGKKQSGKFGFLPTNLHRFVGFLRPRTNLAEKIKKRIEQEKIDVLIVRSGIWNIPYSKIKKACPNLIVCIEINDFLFDEHFHNIWFRPFWLHLEIRLLSHADCFTVVSSNLKDHLLNHRIEEARVLVNPNGVNGSIFSGIEDRFKSRVRSRFGIPHKAFVLGYVGGMEPFRKIPEMVDAVADLRRNGEDDLFLFIIGDGVDRSLVRETLRKNDDVLHGWVACPGWQPYETVPALMTVFDLAIFPFTNPYCSPLKLFEYLAMGLPSIGPDVPAVREVFEHGKHLYLVSQDGSNFKDAILELKRTPELRQRLALNGQKKVLTTYTWSNNVKRILMHIKRFTEQ
jgi:glycosyltransferase involved in cell wall biosynthesis